MIKKTVTLSEKILQTDVRYVFRNGSWVLFGQFASIITTLILSVIFANLLPMHEYGLYKYVLSFVGIIGTLKLTGMHNAVVQATSRGLEKTLDYAVRIVFFWGLIPIFFYAVGSFYYYLSDNVTLALAIGFSGLFNIIIGAFGLYGSYLNGKQSFKKSNIYNTITILVNFLTILTLLLLTNNVWLLVLGNFLSTTLMVTFFYLKIRKDIPKDSKTDYSTLNFGKHLSFINILSGISKHLDKILVFQKLGSVELAIYSFAVAIPEQLRGTYNNFLSIIIPKYASLEKNKLRKSVIKKVFQLTVLSFAIALVYILMAPIIFSMLFPKYIDSVVYSQIYVLLTLTIPSSFLLNGYFQVQEKTHILYRTSILGDSLGLGITAVLIFTMGLLGAVIGNIAARIINVFVLSVYFWKDR